MKRKAAHGAVPDAVDSQEGQKEKKRKFVDGTAERTEAALTPTTEQDTNSPFQGTGRHPAGKKKENRPTATAGGPQQGKQEYSGGPGANGQRGAELLKPNEKKKRERHGKGGIKDLGSGEPPHLAANGDVDEPGGDGYARDPNTKGGRYIVFVGNLPFTSTTASVQAHFASLQPSSVRVLTERGKPSKSRGIAFVEFGGFDRMKTCLEKFHHTEFDDGISPPRKINVELTAGGGGKKSISRRAKINEKNKKLNEERARRVKKAEKAAKEKAEKAKSVTPVPQQQDSVHPSRRKQVRNRR